MRPTAILVLNALGLLLIWGLIEAPRLVAALLLLVAFALPIRIAREVRRGAIDRAFTRAAILWCAPFAALFAAYLAGASTGLCLGCGAVIAGAAHILRLRLPKA